MTYYAVIRSGADNGKKYAVWTYMTSELMQKQSKKYASYPSASLVSIKWTNSKKQAQRLARISTEK